MMNSNGLACRACEPMDPQALHALSLANVMRVMRLRVPRDEQPSLDRVVAQLDESIEALYAIDAEVAAIIACHLLDERGMVLTKAARDALKAITPEAKFVLAMAGSIGNGYPPTSAERKRLRRSEYMIRAALELIEP